MARKSATDSDMHNFWDVVQPCGRGKSLKVLQYLEQKGILPSRASSASFSSGSDTEDRIFQPLTRSPGTCAGRGIVLTEQDRSSMMSFQVGHERWDDAVYSQLRRANKQGYATDAFEYQVKMLHKAQERKERKTKEQFEDSTGDDASSISESACSVSSSLAPSPSPPVSSCSLPAKSSGTNVEGKAMSETDLKGKTKSEMDLGKVKSKSNPEDKTKSESDIEDKVKNVAITEDMTQQPKPAYKSVRARNVLLNSLARMTSVNAPKKQVTGDQLPQSATQEQVTCGQLPQNAPQEQVSGDQLGTVCMDPAHSSVVASDVSASESPLIFHSAASSPQSDADQNLIFDSSDDEYRQEESDICLINDEISQNLIFDSSDDDYRQEEKDIRVINEETSLNQSCINDKFTYNLNPFNDEINHLNSFSQPGSKRIPQYPPFVGQYYDNHHSDSLTVNLNGAGYLFGGKSKSPKFAPPSLVGLESMSFTHNTNNYNTNFKFNLNDFPPLK